MQPLTKEQCDYLYKQFMETPYDFMRPQGDVGWSLITVFNVIDNCTEEKIEDQL